MSKLTKWKKEDWGLIEELEDERPGVIIAIGELEENGQKTYVQEEIYRDIMESICMNNSFYKVYVNFNETPKIVTYFDGMLVANNKHFEGQKRKIMKALAGMYAPDVMKAYIDLQKVNQQKASPAIEILRSRLKEATGEPDVIYQLMFLKPIVEEYVTKDLVKETNATVSTLNSEEFRELIIAMTSNNRFHSKKYAELINAEGNENAKQIAINELIRRYLKGGV